ncbi:MAG: chromate transporter [Caldicoprobacterales bacterium]|nr:chromate transporter [Clostridiales bacterium]
MKKKANIKLLIEMFITFFKIGAFTFGGGYAMIPLIEREVIDNKGWIKNEEEIIDVFAVAESIPGAIAINSSTFVGYKIAGRKGAIVAACGVILPSFITITVIAAFFTRFQDNPIVKAAFMGIRSTVVALILMAAIKVGKKAIKDKFSVLITIMTVILVLVLDIHAIFAIVIGAMVGLVIYFTSPKKVAKIIGKGDEAN